MGKQIEFFQTREDETEFLQMIVHSGYSVVDSNGEKLSIEEAINSKEISLFIIFNNSHIVKSNSGYVDAIVSDTIQYSRGLKKENQLQNSRLWMENKYFDICGVQKNKSKELTGMYNVLVKWIKKYYVRSGCQNYYIGKVAYMQYKEKDLSCIAGPKHIVTFGCQY